MDGEEWHGDDLWSCFGIVALVVVEMLVCIQLSNQYYGHIHLIENVFALIR